MQLRVIGILALGALLSWSAPPALLAQQPKPIAPVAPATPADKVEIRGWALNMSNMATGANQTIQIRVDKWSPGAERDRLIEVFLAKGQKGLLSALEDLPEMGRFNFP